MSGGVKSVMAAGWTGDGSGGWVHSTFALAEDALGFHRDGERGVWRWLNLAQVSGLDQLGTDPDGLPILEFVLFDGSVLAAKFSDDYLARIIERLRQSRVDATSGPPEPHPSPLPEPVVRAAPPASEPEPASESASNLAPNPAPPAARPAGPAAGPAPAQPPASVPPPTGPRTSGVSVLDDLGDPPPPAKGSSKGALRDEVRALRDYIDRLGLDGREELRRDLASLSAHRSELRDEIRSVTADLRDSRAMLVRVRREELLQSVGLYRYRHPLDSSVGLRERMDALRSRIEERAAAGDAVRSADDWTVNGSRSEGRRVLDELSRLLLRTYNAEAEVLVRELRAYEVDAAVDRLGVTRDAIGRLGRSMQIAIDDEYHRMRVEEITLAGDHLARVEEERRALLDRGAGNRLFVASNPGSFGPGVVRIAPTSAIDLESLRAELDSPHLPFRSDIHALLAPADPDMVLEQLRKRFDARRVNLTDPGCQFFRVYPDAVLAELTAIGVRPSDYVLEAEAAEWLRSENARSGGAD